MEWGGGRRSRFARGDMYWKGSTNITAEVHGPIRDKWEALGGAAGLLGYPVADEASVMAGSLAVGRFSRFENGVIYWSSGTGAHEVHGAIRDEWENAWGGATGPLGFPTSDKSLDADIRRSVQQFRARVSGLASRGAARSRACTPSPGSSCSWIGSRPRGAMVGTSPTRTSTSRST